MAKRSLEMAMSYDFDIRHIPLFYLLKSRTLKLEGSNEEAVALLKEAIQLPEVRESIQAGTRLA
jgi:tetratricopeptide repeat protein 21B